MRPTTLESLAVEINEKNGYHGPMLAAATYCAAMLLADVAGNKGAGDYFAERMNAAGAKAPAREVTL